MAFIKFEFQGKEYHIDRYLANALITLVYNVRKDWDFVILVSGNRQVRIGKCLDEEMELLDGKKLKEYKDGEKIKTVSYDFKKGKPVKSQSQIFLKGKEEVYEIELIDGRKVRATPEHKFFIYKRNRVVERELRNLKEGDKIICLKKEELIPSKKIL